MRYNKLIHGESQTILMTQSRLPGADEKITLIIDLLLQLMYHTGPKKSVDTPEGIYHSYCWYQYYQAPYSFRACSILFTAGYYLEASFIVRFLIENFVKMRYLQNHKQQTDNVWAGKKGKKTITIKAIFEEISPGYYEKYYGRHLSGFIHGNLASSTLHFNFNAPTDIQLRGQGQYYDERNAGMVINNFIAIAYGYLKWFPKFFPNGFPTLKHDLSDEYKKTLQWIEKWISGNKETYPKSREWYSKLEKIIM